MPTPDVIVFGAGPAALSVAAACAERGLQVRCLAPDPDWRWHQNYGTWADELDGLGLEGCIHLSWVSPLMSTDAHVGRDLDRRYVRLDTPRLQTLLQARARRAGVRMTAGAAAAVEHDAQGSTITLSSGLQLRARMVIDASGNGSRFLQREPGREPAWQTAYGQLVEVEHGHPWAAGEMVFMDFRLPEAMGGDHARRAEPGLDSDPSFLYAMPFGKNLVFVEETSLIRRPAMELSELQARFRRRADALGLVPRQVISEELCLIRMGGPLPRRSQRTLGYGAAAGMVHPATGYQLVRALREAPAFAEVIAAGLDQGDLDRASRQAWDTLWTRDRLRQWELYAFGADVLCQLDRNQLCRWFDAFFSLEPALWQGFLSATLPANGIARAMASFYLAADPRLKALLINTGARKGGVSLLRTVIGA